MIDNQIEAMFYRAAPSASGRTSALTETVKLDYLGRIRYRSMAQWNCIPCILVFP